MSKRPLVLEARSGEGIVFLDLESDEYSCRYNLDIPVEDYFLLTGSQSSMSATSARPIAVDGWSDLSQHGPSPLSLKDVVRFIVALVKAGIRFRGRTVRDLSGIAGNLGSKHSENHASIREVAHIFGRLLAMLPLQPECLFRSFFLLHFLDRYGLRADWVFGVQLFPFRAHCWVAYGNELLNEVSHAIEDYQIIYRIGRAER